MVPKIWYRWLFVVICGLMLFGLGTILAPDWTRRLFSLLIYASPQAIETRFGGEANAYIVLVHGVLGAVTFGWGLAMLIALRGPFHRGERDGWLLIAVPVAAWFAADTAFSIYTGFWQNAVFNAAFAMAFAVPLIATREIFSRRPLVP